MSRTFTTVAVLCLAAAAFLAGRFAGRGPAEAASSAGSARKVLRWVCPMHPQYTSDHPGDAPCCGMRLEPVYEGSKTGMPEPKLAEGAVAIGAREQQLIGVRVAEVMAAPASHMLRVPGRVAPDESRVHRLFALADGWMRELGNNPAGTFVRKDDVLASYYLPNLLAAQQSFMFALRVAEPGTPDAQGRPQEMLAIPSTSVTLQNAIDSLRILGMSDRQIEEFRKTRRPAPLIHIYSPIDGYVLSRNLSPGQRFEKGAELYRLADTRRVWVTSDLFDKDREFVQPGARALVRYRGREFQARMSDVLPQIDPQTRILKSRLEADNPDNVLRPDAFVDVEIEVRLPAAITAPADAVIDSGLRKTVFVATGEGVFERRAVELGWRLGDRVQILRGLREGERVVVAGNFMVDSESRIKTGASAPPEAPARPAASAKDPICGMDVDPSKPGVLTSRHGSATIYFCSDHCKKTFDADPAKHSGRNARGTE